MNVWERLMFRKVEAWLYMLTILVLLVAGFAFGYLVLRGSTGGSWAVAEYAVEVAAVPTTLKEFAVESLHQGRIVEDVNPDRYFDRPGDIPLNDIEQLVGLPGSLGIPEFLDDGREVYSLYDLATGRCVARWPMDDVARIRTVSFHDMTIIAPRDISGEDDSSGLVKIAQDGSTVWEIGLKVHHPISVDSQGNIYTPTVMPPHPVLTEYVPDYRDDGYAIISPNGQVIDQRSITQILLDNDLGHLLFGIGPMERDAIHLNTVRVAELDSEYWQRGDLLMSSRHLSMVMLYRPSTNSVVWYRIGPWLNQHDPQFISDHEISVFNNNVVWGQDDRHSIAAPQGDGRNQIMVYDFQTDTTKVVYDQAMDRTGQMTITRGRHRVLADGSLFVAFENRGLSCVYRADDTSIHYLARTTGHGQVDALCGIDVYPTRLRPAARPDKLTQR